MRALARTQKSVCRNLQGSSSRAAVASAIISGYLRTRCGLFGEVCELGSNASTYGLRKRVRSRSDQLAHTHKNAAVFRSGVVISRRCTWKDRR